MKEKHTGDLHCHLNGSISLAFLKKTAEKNNCLHLYEELEKANQQYLAGTSQQPEQGYPAELLNLVWKQFGLIHRIVQDLSDIANGVIDVVANSDANYLEIRTTPKPIAEFTVLDYIEAFKRGLEEANQTFTTKKAVGLLSLDRTIHTAQDAQYFLEQIIASTPGVLVGLDISGNPLAKRTLTGEELSKTIELVLENNLSIAIHMDEADTQAEKRDTDTVLNTLAAWKAKQPFKEINPFYGKVRLGHCIYLSVEQQQRIRDLGIPIEVCPTCHNKLNWHDKNQEHPVKKIYNDLSSQPIVFGTDDQFIFGASAKLEFSHGLTFFANSKQLTKKELKEHQAQFRFS
ncbi:adenosine deaminase [Legionella beliardensis]|uniref:Adenosine deaminase n=1 Tax=Legionella beliardensis TaxID=91822 RepID=A0A378I070_9GAMM|nr:hypothetical protein [Legionella beliardensis]STX28587.1 adenosine deaminase [Legionella beliardensis]